jgi:glycerol uptake facilitator protein
MNEYIAEVLGTFILILLGNGVVANVVLKDTKGHQGGWIVITAGWGLGVFIAVLVVSPYSGAHINPAVTLALALSGQFPWNKVPFYMAAQMLGAFAGAWAVFVFYKHHFLRTGGALDKMACFFTTPAIRKPGNNFLSELIGTFVLIIGVLYMSEPIIEIDGHTATKVGLGSLDALPVGLLVFVIGLSLGGTTGYAINPARDLGPRISYALLPIRDKGKIDWNYAIVPVLGPFAGAATAVLMYLILGH